MGPLGALNVLAKGRTARNFFTATDLQLAEQTNPNICLSCYTEWCQSVVSAHLPPPPFQGRSPRTFSPLLPLLKRKKLLMISI